MLTKELLAHPERVQDIWSRLIGDWAIVPDHQFPMWNKKCRLFDIYIENYDAGEWHFEVVGNGKVVHEQEMRAVTTEEAKEEGDQLALLLLINGVETLGKTTLNLDITTDEVRFAQLIEIEGRLYGLSKDGVIYTWTVPTGGGVPGWSPTMMGKAKSQTVPPTL